jgi:hypothetical protein
MKIQTDLEFNAPASTAWRVFGEQFADVSVWADAIEDSAIDRPVALGAVRTCDLKAVGPFPAGQVTEELTVFDSGSRSLSYVVLSGVPGFMRFIENAWTIEAIDDGRSRITSVLTVNVAWWGLPMVPLVRGQLKGSVRGFVEQFAAHIEAQAS